MLIKASELIGSHVLTHYRVDSLLARGGSGMVFAGIDLRDAAEVAIKFVASGIGDESRARRFAREQRAAASLQHPNIVKLLASGTAPNEAPVLVWERLHGQTLQSRIERPPPMTIAEVLDCVVPVMQALRLAHEDGVVHRDVKPANVFIHEDAGRAIPKLLDFGIAALHDASRMTQPGAVVGTLPYVAPERLTHGKASAQGDVWSVGVLLFRCLSGRLPHAQDGQAPDALALRIATQAPASLLRVAPELPKRLSAVVDRALSRRLDLRYPTMDAFLQALEQVHPSSTGHGARAVGAPGGQADEGRTEPIDRVDPARRGDR